MKKDGKEVVKKEATIVEVVSQKIKALEAGGNIAYPKNYDPQSALRSAGLVLAEVVDKDKKPALEVCSVASVSESLLKMVMLGLNPAKKQCYFIVYGTKLQLSVSYMGNMAIAKSVRPEIGEILAQVVWKGDEFEYQILRGRKLVTKHNQTIENIDAKEFIAAYCEILDKDGSVSFTEVMTEKEIKQAWKQSKMNPVNAEGKLKIDSTHDKFTGEMAKKTVINRACKYIVNTSDDSNLVVQAVKKAELGYTEVEFEADIDGKENTKIIDITPEPVGPDEVPKIEDKKADKDNADQSGLKF